MPLLAISWESYSRMQLSKFRDREFHLRHARLTPRGRLQNMGYDPSEESYVARIEPERNKRDKVRGLNTTIDTK